jgi:hypothetical protein
MNGLKGKPQRLVNMVFLKTMNKPWEVIGLTISMEFLESQLPTLDYKKLALAYTQLVHVIMKHTYTKRISDIMYYINDLW